MFQVFHRSFFSSLASGKSDPGQEDEASVQVEHDALVQFICNRSWAGLGSGDPGWPNPGSSVPVPMKIEPLFLW